MRPEDLQRLLDVAHDLGELRENTILVGGAVLPLYLDPVHADSARVTIDVDVLHSASKWTDRVRLDDALRERGWLNAMQDAPICRWKTPRDITVDVLSPAEEAMGFTNPWFAPCWDDVRVEDLGADVAIRIFNVTSYLATKIAAFRQRGSKNWYASKDLEDIISVLAGRASLVDDIETSQSPARHYVIDWFGWLHETNTEQRGDIVAAHLDPELLESPDQVTRVGGTIMRISNLAQN